MRLVGQLSNPSGAQDRILSAVAGGLPSHHGPAEPPVREDWHGNGVVQRAVLAVCATATRSQSVRLVPLSRRVLAVRYRSTRSTGVSVLALAGSRFGLTGSPEAFTGSVLAGWRHKLRLGVRCGPVRCVTYRDSGHRVGTHGFAETRRMRHD